jgi:hypothetical protein
VDAPNLRKTVAETGKQGHFLHREKAQDEVVVAAYLPEDDGEAGGVRIGGHTRIS